MFEKIITAGQLPEVTSRIFYELQEISGDACASWHATGSELAVRGLMWVVVRYEVKLMRAMIPGEQIRLTTWASPVRHRMSQRNYLAYDKDGELLLNAAGIWTVVDRKTRSMVNPDEYDIEFGCEVTGLELPRPGSPVKIPQDKELKYSVDKSVLDINCHMNNIRYFDLVQSCIGSENDGMQPSQIQAVFMNEALLGEQMTIRWGKRENYWFFTGQKSDVECFHIGIQYVLS